MRDFSRTTEPGGEAAPATAGNRFVIQKHAARRLHYDFRLELDGVLLSWAVPRGPSLSPAERRLAVRTEDHPLAYADFEGVIPAGQYAPVAVPISWEQLALGIDAATFTIHSLPRYLARREHDPWAELHAVKQAVTAATWRALGRRGPR